MAWYLLPLAVDGLALWLFSRLVAYDPRYLWARTFPVAIGIPALGVAAVVVAYTKTASLSIHGVAWDVFLAALFTLPLAPLATWWVAERFLKLIHAPDAAGIPENRTCDQAARAENEGRFAEAEALYRDALFRQKLGTRPAGAGIHLAFANYLQRRGREAEAAEHWEAAVRYGIGPEQALTAAVRASEVYTVTLKRPARAAQILRLALRKHPDLPEAYALRQRIETLEERPDA